MVADAEPTPPPEENRVSPGKFNHFATRRGPHLVTYAVSFVKEHCLDVVPGWTAEGA